MTSFTPLHPDTHIGSVQLKVADLARSVDFYTQVIGLRVLSRPDAAQTIMGAGDQPLLTLRAVPGGQPPLAHHTGLYHAAILLPTRRALAAKVRQLVDLNQRFGYADHLVSEAFYLNDPDGNGLELYRDRPRDEWRWNELTVEMANAPIDFDSLFAELNGDNPTDPAVPAGTMIGHMHLKIGDVRQAEAFYHDILGFDVTARWPGALFMSAGGYHHHLGLNTWESRSGSAAPPSATGLHSFSIIVPDTAEQERIAARLQSAGISTSREDGTLIAHDPWHNELHFVV